MAYRPEFESEKEWRIYLENATEKEAYEALSKVLRLAKNFAKQHKPTGEYMNRMFDSGSEIYATRFGHEWVPF